MVPRVSSIGSWKHPSVPGLGAFARDGHHQDFTSPMPKLVQISPQRVREFHRQSVLSGMAAPAPRLA